MKKTLIAIAAASSIVAAGSVSANCTMQKSGYYHGSATSAAAPIGSRGGFIRTGGYQAQVAQPDIIDTAIAAGTFSTLVKAVQAAGLAETLKGDGPFTVFAPTDAAFSKLPAGTLEALLNDKQKLAQILKYHVVPGRLDATAVTSMSKLGTVAGADLPVNSIKIATTDIMTSNGVIHVIDEVLIPAS